MISGKRPIRQLHCMSATVKVHRECNDHPMGAQWKVLPIAYPSEGHTKDLPMGRSYQGSTKGRSYQRLTGHDIGHWPAGPTTIFSCRASSGHKHAFFTGPNGPLGNSSGHWWVWRTLARRRWWLCLQSPRKQQTVASLLMGICHHGVAVPWLCLALSLMTQPTAQSIMWLPDTVAL